MFAINGTDAGTPAAQGESVTLIIDGAEVTVPAGTSIMRAAAAAGGAIPKLCATDTLKAFGSCRVCLVEVEGQRGYPASCTTLVAPGMMSMWLLLFVTYIREVRFGWDDSRLCLLIVPERGSRLEGLEIEVRLVGPRGAEDLVLTNTLLAGGSVRTECTLCPQSALETTGAWNEVVELAIVLPEKDELAVSEEVGLLVRIGRDGMSDYVFHSAHLGTHGGVNR
jgi:hypothetical protein